MIEDTQVGDVISMKQLLEAGVHFGHQMSQWNPRMKPYIFGSRNGIHIIDLQQTANLFRTVYGFVEERFYLWERKSRLRELYQKRR